MKLIPAALDRRLEAHHHGPCGHHRDHGRLSPCRHRDLGCHRPCRQNPYASPVH